LPKVSSHVREYSRFKETFGRDWVPPAAAVLEGASGPAITFGFHDETVLLNTSKLSALLVIAHVVPLR
jgi:hypothetical protein